MTSDDNTNFEEPQLVSKSQRKREAIARQELGESLTRLTPQKLATLPLSQPLADAITAFQRLPNKHGAKKRQLQFIGKLMRDLDESQCETLSDATHQDQPAANESTPDMATISRAILERGDSVVEGLMQACPQLDRQQLRSLFREYNRITNDNNAKKSRLVKRAAAQLGLHTDAQSLACFLKEITPQPGN